MWPLCAVGSRGRVIQLNLIHLVALLLCYYDKFVRLRALSDALLGFILACI